MNRKNKRIKVCQKYDNYIYYDLVTYCYVKAAQVIIVLDNGYVSWGEYLQCNLQYIEISLLTIRTFKSKEQIAAMVVMGFMGIKTDNYEYHQKESLMRGVYTTI